MLLDLEPALPPYIGLRRSANIGREALAAFRPVPPRSGPSIREVGVEDEFLVSYEAVTPGIPVLTRDKQQFGILEHLSLIHI